MAIAFDAATWQSFVAPSGGTITKAHTCTGADRGLIVFVRGNDNSDACSGVTYAGVTMTQFIKFQETGIGNNLAYNYGFYLANPASGTNNVVASFINSNIHCMGIISYTGVSQSAMYDNSAYTEVTYPHSSITLSLTTNADNCWYVGNVRGYGGGESATSGNGRLTTPSVGMVVSDNGPKTPAGSVSLSYNISNNYGNGIIVSIAPKVASALKSNFAMFFQ